MYITGCDHYIEIQLQKEKIITYITLAEVIQKLSPDDFSRIHKSYIIHHQYLETLEPGQVMLQGGITLPIGRAYRAAFMEKLKHSLLVSKWDQSFN
jgi:two-component system LytT family response regulator